MRKLIFIAIFCSISFLSFATETPDGFKWYMTDYQDVLQRINFHLTDTPYLYLHFPQPVRLGSLTFSQWIDSAGFVTQDTRWVGWPTEDVPYQDLWITLNWNDIPKIEGWWRVQGTNLSFTNGLRLGCTAFRFAPEPVSFLLFLFGGAGLIGGKIRLRRDVK